MHAYMNIRTAIIKYSQSISREDLEKPSACIHSVSARACHCKSNCKDKTKTHLNYTNILWYAFYQACMLQFARIVLAKLAYAYSDDVTSSGALSAVDGHMYRQLHSYGALLPSMHVQKSRTSC
jgi:hypothetical protein